MKHVTVSFNYFYKIHTVSVTILQYIMNFINLDKALSFYLVFWKEGIPFKSHKQVSEAYSFRVG